MRPSGQAVEQRHQGGLVDAELGRDFQLGALRLVAGGYAGGQLGRDFRIPQVG